MQRRWFEARYLRKEILHLTQGALGEPLGLTRANIANIEANRISVTDRVVIGLCDKYNVSEKWLRKGEGEIFQPSDDKLARYVSEITDSNDTFIKSFIEVYWELDDTSKAVIKNIAKKMLEKQKRE